MIITRSPLRLSLGGGGTDLPSYYQEFGGYLIAAAIDKYVYITVHQSWTEDLIVKYSKLEKVSDVSQLQHPIVREAIQLTRVDGHHLEITSMADIPAGTGLGSSGSFTTALLKALYTFRGETVTNGRIAEEACHIEMNLLNEPVGKQDQYIAAIGGITEFHFASDGQVTFERLRVQPETLHNLEDNLILFFTGYTRSASAILSDQKVRSESRDQAMIDNLHFVKQIGIASREALLQGDLHRFSDLMKEHWEHKKLRSKGMSNSAIDQLYDLAMQNGAMSGKLIGAGGGGFLMFYSEEKTRLRRAMTAAGLREVRIRFDHQGTKVIS
jgi:D-glycero-alpha-D-manno-heptose-7-phosphate kinase